MIEDLPEMRRNIPALLRDYETIKAEHGRKGLELARQQKPSLILCDVMMPELGGHGLAGAATGCWPGADPLIFLPSKEKRTICEAA